MHSLTLCFFFLSQLLKQDKVIKLNMFGLTIGTYDKFEELYKFMMRTKYTVMSVQERVQA